MIDIKGLSLRLGRFTLKDISVKIESGEYFVILGPSGAGKTVFMECLAGIHKVKEGEILKDGVNISRLAPEQRGMGYVPQDYVLFPFLNVRENIIFGLKRGKHDRGAIEKRLSDLAGLLGIDYLLDRNTVSLSGGEKQRVALARALAPAPGVLLLDEPLSSLDVQTSKYLRLELRRIHQELKVTTIHITHNHLEAEELADRMAIMTAGRIEQVGKPQEIFFAPETAAVADFIGSLNILECDSCRQLVPGLMEVECSGIRIVLPHDEGDMKKIAISPRDVYVSDVMPPGPAVNRYTGTVTAIDTTSATARLEVKIGRTNIKAEMPGELAREMDLMIGKEVFVILKLRRLKVLGSRESAAPKQYKWYYQEII
jgi:molybdate/tungstate transport system ATP-binding protein